MKEIIKIGSLVRIKITITNAYSYMIKEEQIGIILKKLNEESYIIFSIRENRSCLLFNGEFEVILLS